MPTYTYECGECLRESERNVPIANRDEQDCTECGRELKRTVSFTGLTWAPTAGGMR